MSGEAETSVNNKYQGEFSWEVADDNSGKKVKYEICLDGNESKYITSTKNTVKISSLSVGDHHTIQIRAVDSSKNPGAWSDTHTFTVKDMVAPKSTAVKVKVSNNNVLLNWKTPKDDVGVVGYELQYRRQGTEEWKIVNFDADEFSFDLCLDKGTYEYQMLAFDEAENYSVKKSKFSVKTELALESESFDLVSWQNGYISDMGVSTWDLPGDDLNNQITSLLA